MTNSDQSDPDRNLELGPLHLLDSAIKRTSEYVGTRSRRGVGHDDADDVHGTIETDDAIDFDPRPLLRALAHHGVQAVVVGQVAGIMHGSEELTGDLDFVWSGDPTEAGGLVTAFADVDATLTDNDGKALTLDANAFALPKVQFDSANASGDCCTLGLPWGELDMGGVLDRALTATDGDTTIHFASRKDLIAMRLAVGRQKDLRRAAELEELKRSLPTEQGEQKKQNMGDET